MSYRPLPSTFSVSSIAVSLVLRTIVAERPAGRAVLLPPAITPTRLIVRARAMARHHSRAPGAPRMVIVASAGTATYHPADGRRRERDVAALGRGRRGRPRDPFPPSEERRSDR